MSSMKHGFTLIELLVAVTIIALLSAASIVGFNKQQKHARETRRLSDVGEMGIALENYFSINSSYPTVTGATTTALAALVSTGALTALPKDQTPGGGASQPWCTGYYYRYQYNYGSGTMNGVAVGTRQWSIEFGAELAATADGNNTHLLDPKVWHLGITTSYCTSPRYFAALLGSM